MNAREEERIGYRLSRTTKAIETQILSTDVERNEKEEEMLLVLYIIGVHIMFFIVAIISSMFFSLFLCFSLFIKTTVTKLRTCIKGDGVGYLMTYDVSDGTFLLYEILQSRGSVAASREVLLRAPTLAHNCEYNDALGRSTVTRL